MEVTGQLHTLPTLPTDKQLLSVLFNLFYCRFCSSPSKASHQLINPLVLCLLRSLPAGKCMKAVVTGYFTLHLLTKCAASWIFCSTSGCPCNRLVQRHVTHEDGLNWLSMGSNGEILLAGIFGPHKNVEQWNSY
jgi:hypothetical protein